MGQKVNPTSLRVGINKYWQSTWFEKKDYSCYFIVSISTSVSQVCTALTLEISLNVVTCSLGNF